MDDVLLKLACAFAALAIFFVARHYLARRAALAPAPRDGADAPVRPSPRR